MSKREYSRLPTVSSGEVWTYFVSRNSVDGALADTCSLWCIKPKRVRLNECVTWTGAPGHLGDFSPEHVAGWFRVYPETDLELIRVEQIASERMMAAAKKQGLR